MGVYIKGMEMPNDGTIGGYNAVVMSAEIKDAPTIIEAEK